MNDVEQVFEQCPDCGRYLVKLGPHSCDAGGSSTPTREQRTRIAESDPRPEDDEVLLLPTRKVDGSYAYHEADDDHTPRCGGGGSLDDDDWTVLPRREARARGRSPCMTCLRLTDDVDATSAVTSASDELAALDASAPASRSDP